MLCKCSGKYIDIYFNLKITCRAHGRAPPDHYYRDLDILLSRYAQLSLALEESLQGSSSGHRGRSPVIVSHRVASPSDAPHPHRPDSSSLQRPHLSPWPGSSSQDRRRPRDASSGLHHHSRHSQECYQDRFASSAEPRHSRRPRSRGSPSPKRLEFTSKGLPLSTANGIRFKGVPFSTANGIRLKRVPLSKANVIRFWRRA